MSGFAPNPMKYCLLVSLLTLGWVSAAPVATATVQQAGANAEAGEDLLVRYEIARQFNVHNRYAADALLKRRETAASMIEQLELIGRGTDAMLRWSTAFEAEDTAFEIEYRLVDSGMEFVTVGFIPGSGASDAEQRYRFGFTRLKPGNHEFRLKVVNSRGLVARTESVQVQVGGEPAFALGEPAHDTSAGFVYVPFSLREPGIARLVIVDPDGALVETLVFGSQRPGTHVARFPAALIQTTGFWVELSTEAGDTSRPVCLAGKSGEGC